MLLPPPDYVYGADVDPVIVVHVSDVSDPSEQLLGIGVRITVNGTDGGVQKNVGRDNYIKLRNANGAWFPDGVWSVTLQTEDMLGRARGEPATVTVSIDRSRPSSGRCPRPHVRRAQPPPRHVPSAPARASQY